MGRKRRRQRPSFKANSDLHNLFHLALRLGMTVGRLKKELTAKEYVYWIAFMRRMEREDKKGRRG